MKDKININNIKLILSKFNNLKLGLRVKILTPTIFLIVLGYLVNTTVTQTKFTNMLIQSGMNQASLAAQYVASSLNPDYVKTMKKGSEGSTIYLKLNSELSSIVENEEFDAAYAITKDANGDYVYALDSSHSDLIGSVIDYDEEQITLAFEGYAVTNNYIEEYEGVKIITSYYPLLDSAGYVSSVVGIDYNATELQNSINEQARNSAIRIVAFIAFTTSIVALILIMMVRDIGKVDSKLGEIAGSAGDLTQEVKVESNDEIGSIARHLNNLLQKLNNMMCSIKDSVDIVKSSTNDITSSCVRTNDEISMMSAAMQEIAASMEVVQDTVKSIGESFKMVIDVSKTISDSSNDKANSIKPIIENVNEIYDSSIKSREEASKYAEEISDKVSKKIKESEAVKEIDELTKTVLDIASQTKLLSLNASIEASRAGESGRGFSVVATEMGRLAEQSAEAASAIQKINKDVTEAVTGLTYESEKLIEFSKDVTDKGYTKLADLASEYKDTISSIGDDLLQFAESSSNLNSEINVVNESIDIVVMTVDECNHAINDVNTSVGSIMESTGTILESSDENSKNVETLSEYIDTFKFRRSNK